MKNKSFIITVLSLIVAILCIVTNNNFISKKINSNKQSALTQIGTATVIDDNTLLELSTLDTLELNFTKLPTVTVKSSYEYVIEGEDGVNRGRPQIGDSDTVKQPIRSVTFTGVPYDQEVDINVTARFDECGTLNDKSIDMVIEYSDFYSATEYTGDSSYYKTRNNSKVLWWTAYGSIDDQIPTNEWFQRGFQAINTKVYFYYHGETTPIHLDVGYFTLYSIDGDSTHSEAVSSTAATKTLLFQDTGISYKESLVLGNTTYPNVFYSATTLDSTKPKTTAVSYQYKNVDHIDFNLHILTGLWSAGYHVNFSSLSATLPDVPEKTVSSESIRAGEKLQYIIEQSLPKATDSNFALSSFEFVDNLETQNLEYTSLRVYNDNNTDITSTAGTTTYTDGELKYVFNSEYLSTLTYTGQKYKFIIDTTVQANPGTNIIGNCCKSTFNEVYELTSNTVNTNVVSNVRVKYVDENGIELIDSKNIDGNLYDEYTTSPEEIAQYELIDTPDNASGTFSVDEIIVTYTYKKVLENVEINFNWDDNNSTERPKVVTVKLESTAGLSEEIEVTADEEWYFERKDVDIYDESGNEITYTISVLDLSDKYYIYNTISDKYQFTIESAIYGSIKIQKIDSITTIPLADARFLIEISDGDEWKEVGEYTTDEAGTILADKLIQGNYRITETHAPIGYRLNDVPTEIEITEVNLNYIMEMPNVATTVLPSAGGNKMMVYTSTISFLAIGFLVCATSTITIGKRGKRGVSKRDYFRKSKRKH